MLLLKTFLYEEGSDETDNRDEPDNDHTVPGCAAEGFTFLTTQSNSTATNDNFGWSKD